MKIVVYDPHRLCIPFYFCLLEVFMAKTKAKEATFKTKLYAEIRDTFPGSKVLINDPTLIQGIPDATVLFPNGQYTLLEGKRSADEAKQPNQEYYVNQSPLASNAMFVYPENKKEVLEELKRRYEK